MSRNSGNLIRRRGKPLPNRNLPRSGKKVVGAMGKVKQLKKDFESMKDEIDVLLGSNRKFISDRSNEAKSKIRYILTHLPVSQDEKQTIWNIIEAIEGFRNDCDELRKDVEVIQTFQKVALPKEINSINDVVRNLLVMQNSDFERKLQGMQKEKDTDLKAKRDLKAFFFKQGKVRKTMKRRFFHFKMDCTFSYYNEKNMKKVIDTVDCKPYFRVSIDSEMYDDFCLKVKTKGREYKLLLSNEEDLNRWKKDLKIWYRLNSGNKETKGSTNLNDLLTKNVK